MNTEMSTKRIVARRADTFHSVSYSSNPFHNELLYKHALSKVQFISEIIAPHSLSLHHRRTIRRI